jgi:Cyclic nucleotide-binding domain
MPSRNRYRGSDRAADHTCTVGPASPHMAGETLFLESFERGGHGFGREAPLLLIDQSGCSRKIFRNSGRFGICVARMRPWCSGRGLLRCDKPGTLQKLLRQTSLPASHQYGLQMTDSEAVMNLLRKVPLFANLKDEDKVCIEEAEEWRLPAGEMLVKEGKPAEHFFVLLEGEMRVWKEHDDQDIVFAPNRPGAFFGEVPLLLGTPYMLSDRAESDCRLIVFPEEAFWKLLRLCPAISGEIFRSMARRLRNIEGSAWGDDSWEVLCRD